MKTILSFILILSAPIISANVHEYAGSSFKEVLSVIKDEGFAPRSADELVEYQVYQSGKLPEYPMNAASIFKPKGELQKDAKRTVSERFDYYDRLAKRLHPNGVCVVGTWKADKPSAYTGMFREGSEGLFVGRISVAMQETDYKEKRGFGFAGKIFPTMDPKEVVTTGNFFTVDILLGQKKQNFLETALTNQPETGFDLSLIGLGLKIASALKKGDEDPGFRPLTQVSELNETGAIKSPQWIRLSPVHSAGKSSPADFRAEVVEALKMKGSLVFNVETSETSKGNRKSADWNRIGQIVVSEAIVSYGCDRRLHFSHPKKH